MQFFPHNLPIMILHRNCYKSATIIMHKMILILQLLEIYVLHNFKTLQNYLIGFLKYCLNICSLSNI